MNRFSYPTPSEHFMSITLRDGFSLEEITPSNQNVYDNLSQVYEMEFSNQTGFDPDQNGHYPIATKCPDEGIRGWILRDEKGCPAGFTIIQTLDNRMDIQEFFVTHKHRRFGVGTEFAAAIMQQYPGPWQLRELLTSPWATPFWRKFLQKMEVEYTEDIAPDREWGHVVRQQFTIPK